MKPFTYCPETEYKRQKRNATNTARLVCILFIIAVGVLAYAICRQ